MNNYRNMQVIEADSREGITSLETSANSTLPTLSYINRLEHKLRTPLNSILGIAQILQSNQLTTEEQQASLNLILQSGNELLKVINNLIDLAHLEEGALHVEAHSVNLQEIIEDVVSCYLAKASEKNLPLIIDSGCQPNYEVLGDPERIKQILHTLLDNAIRYTSHGYVLIKVHAVKEPHQPNSCINISISDTGIGIADEQLRTIFSEETTNANHNKKIHTYTTLPGHQKTYIGLALAKELAKLMSGSITATSQQGKGTSVTLSLILNQQLSLNNLIEPDQSLAGLNILLLDDNVLRRDIWNQQIISWGAHCKTLALNEGLTALYEAANKNNPYHIIIASTRIYDHHIAYLGRAIRTNSMFNKIMLAVALSSEHLDYQLEQAGVSGYACVLNALQPSSFAQKLAQSWEAWTEKLNSNCELFLLARHKVLLVEDNDINQKVAKIMLHNLGCDVDVAATGQDALKLLTSEIYDLVFMDVGLPDIDGFEVTAKFRELENQNRRTPIIALSAHATEQAEEIGLRSGMDAYIIKPILFEGLHSVLAEWLPN